MRSTLRRIVQAGPGSVARRGIRSVIRRHVRMVAVAVVISLLLASLPATSNPTQAGSRQDRARANTRGSESLQSQLYRGFSQTLASLGSWLAGRMNSESASSHSTYYPVTAFLSPPPPFIDAPSNLTVTTTSSTTISLSWTAPAGSVDHYQIERSTNVSGPFFFLANAAGTTHNDPTVSNLQAYLYRVRAVTSGGLPSAPSNMALGTAISFQFSNLQGQQIFAQHFHDVRTAVNAVRAIANLAPASWTRPTLAGLEVKADDGQELRNRLNEALTALAIPVTPFEDPTLNTSVNGTLIKAIHIEQLQTRSTRGSSTSFGPLDSDSSTARLDPLNETGGGGENPLSRNFNWNLGLVKLRGRAGLDLSLPLSYNSLIWTKIGNFMAFDSDQGFPAPGFRFGFPVIQLPYYNAEVGKYAYLLIGSDGSRTEMRQVGTSVYFEAGDSSHLLLDTSLSLPAPDNDKFVLRTTDGTRLLYAWKGDAYQVTQIKDRNGNYLTINYTPAGRIGTIIDTLNRTITFNYDANGWLTSITQPWAVNGQSVTHTWASFAYQDVTIQTNYTGLTPQLSNGSILKMLSQVTLDDGSRFNFDYTSWGQVWKIRNYAADNHLLNYRSYNLPLTNSTAHTDCPRFTERRDWAENFNRSGNPLPGYMLPTGSEQEAVTTYAIPTSDSWTMPDSSAASGTRAQVTAPDGTTNKIYFIGSAGTSSGWRRGLTALVNTYASGNTLRRQVMTTWKQDNEAVSYQLNPRVEETNIYDPGGNQKRTRVTYQAVTLPNSMSCKLPQDVYEYQANATTVLRRTHTDYNLAADYLNRRIIGLPGEKTLYEVDPGTSVETLMSKVSFQYDESGSIQGTDAPVQHHNTDFSASFVTGRANVSSVKRYDVTTGSPITTTSTKYNTAGAVVSSKDALNHEVTFTYTDAFAASGANPDSARPFATFAYPTSIKDADQYSTEVRYHYDFGAVTWKRTPQPNVTTNTPGPEQVISYDGVGRVQQITSLVNNAYTKLVYSNSQNRVDTYVAIQEVAGQIQEAHSFSISDGLGRVFAIARAHNEITGSFAAQLTLFDAMGRAIKTSNPTETSASGSPKDWQPTGDDVIWHYTEQTYDWKGRPLLTINQDGSTKTANYEGCGCAGGEVVTLTDEGTGVAPNIQKRQQRIYSDVLGRPVKTEILNWEGGSVYSTTVNTYNGRDQIKQIRQYAGVEGSGTFQDSTMTYDGHGRLKTRHVPAQNVGTNTVWTYNADDTINTITDSRGVITNHGYNARHLVTSTNYSAPAGITPTENATFGYDAAGNRISMIDGVGSRSYNYNQLSRMTSETQSFTELAGSYPLTYDYNLAGQLTSLAEPSQFGAVVSYAHDSIGRLTAVTGSGGISAQLLTGMEYRASGALKHANYGDGPQINVSYNSRLLPTRYELTNVYLSQLVNPGYYTVGTDNDYYADGRLRYARDLQDGNFDRAFEFDHAGRLKEAYTGREARGLPPNNPADSPYRQSYNYDVWNNMSRTGRHWTLAVSDTPTYVNNRRSDWTYDANGSVTSRESGQRTHAYDAARQQRNFYESGFDQWGSYWMEHQYTINQTYDGNGMAGKRIETRYSEDENGPVENSTETTYQLRSSVLGGALIVEIDELGYRSRGQIYAGGELLADYQFSAPDTITTIRHRNPTTGQWVKGALRTELDPLGADVGSVSPYALQMTYSDIIGSENLYYHRGNPMDIRGGCALDGMPISCSDLQERMERGWVEEEHMLPAAEPTQPSLNSSGSPTVTNALRTYRFPIVSLGLGIFIRQTPVLAGGPVGQGNNEGYYLDWREEAFYFAPQKTEPKRNCTFPSFDQLGTAQQGLLDAGAYSTLSDAQRANFLNQTGALAKAGINLGDAVLQDGGILTDRLLFQPGESLRTFRGSIEAAIASGTFIKDTPVASKHPGMSDFGARQNRTFNALQVGFGPDGAFVDIDRGNPSGGLAGLIVHGAEVMTPGKTDPFAVGKKLGRKVTGYTCK